MPQSIMLAGPCPAHVPRSYVELLIRAVLPISAEPHTCVHFGVNALRAPLCRLLRLIAIGLQLPEDFFDPFFDAAISNIRTIRYLPGQHRAQDGVFGVGAHQLPLPNVSHTFCIHLAALAQPGSPAQGTVPSLCIRGARPRGARHSMLRYGYPDAFSGCQLQLHHKHLRCGAKAYRKCLQERTRTGAC